MDWFSWENPKKNGFSPVIWWENPWFPLQPRHWQRRISQGRSTSWSGPWETMALNIWHQFAVVITSNYRTSTQIWSIIHDNSISMDCFKGYILVGGFNPSEKWWSKSQLGWWNSQLNGNKNHVPNHQPDNSIINSIINPIINPIINLIMNPIINHHWPPASKSSHH